MSGKGLLSSTDRGFSLHKVSSVWVSKRDGVAFLVLCFSRWADALCFHSGRREGASSYEMNSCEGVSGSHKWELQCRRLSRKVRIPWKGLGETKADIPIFTFENHTGNRFRVCDLLDLWEEAALLSVVVAYLCNGGLSVSALYADTARVGAVAGHWSQAGNSSSDWGRCWSHAQTSTLLPRVTSLIPHWAGYWINTNISSLTQEPAAQGQISTDYSHACNNDCHLHLSFFLLNVIPFQARTPIWNTEYTEKASP